MDVTWVDFVFGCFFCALAGFAAGFKTGTAIWRKGG
jgi:hypothetical protein